MTNYTSGWPNYSGFGPNSFNKRQLLEIIRQSSIGTGKKTKRKFSLNSKRTALVNEAKRLRKGYFTWSDFGTNRSVQILAGR